MSTKISEAQLRDLIASNITCLKSGLKLLCKEKYIPNDLGTRGFIDLYATDEKNRHVLIEIKKSNSTAREALHEIFKYVEGVKKYLSAKESEIHIIVASTEWQELLVPFSHVYNNSDLSIEGVIIRLDDEETTFEADSVAPLKTNNGRFIAPWHMEWWYVDKKQMLVGVRQIQDYYSRVGVDDYIIAVLKLRNKTFQDFEYCAYSAKHFMDVEHCLEILKRNEADINNAAQEDESESYDEIIEIIHRKDVDNETILMTLHMAIDEIPPWPICDQPDIGYPAKFREMIRSDNTGGCEIIEMMKFGSFARNPLIVDGTIVSEICGEDGSGKAVISCTFDAANKAEMKAFKDALERCLAGNSIWRAHINQILEEILREHPKAEIDTYVFYPSTGIHTIYYACTNDDRKSYLPQYYIAVKDYIPKIKDIFRTTLYSGCLTPFGKSKSFEEILRRHFSNSTRKLWTPLLWGGYDGNDVEILRDIGLMYKSYRVSYDWSNPKLEFTGGMVRFSPEQTLFSLTDGEWRQDKKSKLPPIPAEMFERYIQAHKDLISDIIEAVGTVIKTNEK